MKRKVRGKLFKKIEILIDDNYVHVYLCVQKVSITRVDYLYFKLSF